MESAAEVLILGAGGAGLMAAITAAGRGRRVRVLDHAPRPGGKILISGGGRCNFSNLSADPSHYRSQNPHFSKSALARYRPSDFIALVRKHKIRFHEKKLGQLFCDGSAREIVDMLCQECRDLGVEISCGLRVESVAPDGDGFQVTTPEGELRSRTLVVATGGLSFPKLGASDLGYRLARQFGLNVLATAPALDGFVFGPDEFKSFAGLSGLSVDASVTVDGRQFRENVLFTHRGLSGPACLQASLYWEPGATIHVDLIPQGSGLMALKLAQPRLHIQEALSACLPRRLSERWTARLGLAVRPLAEFRNSELENLEAGLKNWEFIPVGTVGYDHAEVTRGGVDTREISSKSMECKKVPGLYFIGEVVDVTGELGGYNFQWAWASAHAAGCAV